MRSGAEFTIFVILMSHIKQHCNTAAEVQGTKHDFLPSFRCICLFLFCFLWFCSLLPFSNHLTKKLSRWEKPKKEGNNKNLTNSRSLIYPRNCDLMLNILLHKIRHKEKLQATAHTARPTQ